MVGPAGPGAATRPPRAVGGGEPIGAAASREARPTTGNAVGRPGRPAARGPLGRAASPAGTVGRQPGKTASRQPDGRKPATGRPESPTQVAIPPLRDERGKPTALAASVAGPSPLAQSMWDQLASLARADLSDVRKRRYLIRLLGRHARVAQHDRHLWRAYALGSLLLGREDLALRWLRLGFARQPGDALWLADFAAALAYDGRLPTAKWIARRALRLLRAKARQLARSPAASARGASEPAATTAAASESGSSELNAERALSRPERELLRTYVRLLRFAHGARDGAWFLPDVLPTTMARALGQDLLSVWNDTDGLASRGFESGRVFRLRPPEPPPEPVAVPKPGVVVASSAPVGQPRAKQGPASVAKSDGDDDDDEEDDDEDDDEDEDDEDEDDEDEDEDSEDGDEDEDEEAAAGLAAVLAASDASVPTVIEAEDESEDPDSDRPYALTAGLDVSDLNGLTLVGGSVRADFTLGRLGLPRFGLGLRTSYVWFSDTHEWLPLYNVGLELGELDFAVVGRYRLPRERGRIEIGLGGNLRMSHGLPYGWLHGEYAPSLGLGSALLLELNVGVNQIIADTNELRLLGTRDRVQLGIDWDLTGREFLNVFFGWQRYQTRRRELMSDGYSLYAELGHRLRLANPGWSVRLSGYLEENSLQPTLPAWVARKVSSDEPVSIDDIVVSGFGMVGLGTTLRRGTPGIAPADDRRFRYFIDIWGGYLWPLDQLGFDLQLGIGYSRPKLGELSLSGYLSNSRFGGGREGASAGLSLRYVY